MKKLKLLTLVAAALFSTQAHAQWVSIPDSNFGKWLNTNGYSQCLQGNSTVGWQMDTTCNAVVTNTTIECGYKFIENLTGIQYFDALKTLGCQANKLTWLPPLPPALEQLDCSTQYPLKITALPALPSTLSVLDCKNNAITVLPSLPLGLTFLDCSGNLLTTLAALPGNLIELTCSGNALGALPALPATLESLKCFNCNLTALPTLPASLWYLYCPQNSLTSLPQLPDSMSYLVCAYNQITSIPPLPSVIRVFSCTSNSLTELPTLPNSLQHLECNSNPQLSELPILPHTLAHLNVGWCNLTVLPAFPDSLGQCDLRGNPIKCLPELKKIKYLWFSNTNITCIPNYIDIYSSTPALNSLPICDVFNDNSCPVLSSISGKVHKSNDADCVFGQGDVQAHNVKVQLWRNGNIFKQNLPHLSTYTFKTEVFSVYQVTVDTLNTPFRIKCPAIGSLTSIISNTDSVDYNMDFALECKPGFDVEAKSMFGAVFRPANTTHVQIAAGDASNFYGAHCSAGVSGSVALSYTGPLSYGGPASGALTPTLSGNTLIWNVADFDNVNFSTDFDVIMQTDTNAQIGQLVSFTLTANPIAGDNNPANNTLTIDFPVVNSYDPNDKQVSPPGNIDTLQEYLTYTVRFQNTGNAEAQHVYITDTLDGDIEPASFQLLAYSHQPMVQIDGNAVKFNFPNINLPDSFSNEPGSHGYVQYKVKLNDNLPIGTTINNTAFIYFDFNSPVVTNTTTNTVSLDADTTVGIHLIIADAQVFVYPNPANSAVTITVSENMQGGVVTLTDMLGRNAIEPVQLNGRAVTMNTEQLPEGVYLVNVQGRGGVSVVKRLVVKK